MGRCRVQRLGGHDTRTPGPAGAADRPSVPWGVNPRRGPGVARTGRTHRPVGTAGGGGWLHRGTAATGANACVRRSLSDRCGWPCVPGRASDLRPGRQRPSPGASTSPARGLGAGAYGTPVAGSGGAPTRPNASQRVRWRARRSAASGAGSGRPTGGGGGPTDREG